MLQIIYVISEEYNVVALLCKMHKFFYLFHPFTRRVPICDMDELRKRLVVARAEFQQSVVDDAFINGEKDWKYVSEQNVVTLNICCNVACLTFHLPYITPGSFQIHQCQPTTGFFSELPTFGGMQHTFSQMKKLCIVQGSAVTFFRCGG